MTFYLSYYFISILCWKKSDGVTDPDGVSQLSGYWCACNDTDCIPCSYGHGLLAELGYFGLAGCVLVDYISGWEVRLFAYIRTKSMFDMTDRCYFVNITIYLPVVVEIRQKSHWSRLFWHSRGSKIKKITQLGQKKKSMLFIFWKL